ncbi:MAG: HesA/MoeB/ThiF family protein [Syntrophobacteraceae bacterium]
MNLVDLAITVEYAGEQKLIIDDEDLLAWARENGRTPGEAQIVALESGIVPHRYLKNLTALTLSEQLRICGSAVFVCGCGGLGGTLVNLLSRAGTGFLRIADCDVFAPSNLNRQLLSDIHQMSRPKAETALDSIAAINPFVRVESRTVLLDQSNAESLVSGCDLVLDAMDNIAGRFALAEAAARLNIPFVHAAVAGWWGQVCTFPPGSRVSLSNIYGNRRVKEDAEDAVGVMGPAAAVIGSLQAFEALRILSGRQPSYANRLLYFDGETGEIVFLPLK